MTKNTIAPSQHFTETVYEIAFGDNAINKEYPEGEVLARIREFSDKAYHAEPDTLIPKILAIMASVNESEKNNFSMTDDAINDLLLSALKGED